MSMAIKQAARYKCSAVLVRKVEVSLSYTKQVAGNKPISLSVKLKFNDL